MAHYAVSDLHGDYFAFQTLQNILNKDKDSHLFFLGDATDRGLIGYTIIKWLLDKPNVTYLRGNHEELFRAAIYGFYKTWKKFWPDKKLSEIMATHTVPQIMMKDLDMQCYMKEGGIYTFDDWLKDGAPISIFRKLSELPLKCSYKQYDMCHAGATIEAWERESVDDLLWDRKSFCEPWYPGRTLIHGHTPIPYMPKNFLPNSEQLNTQPLFYYPNMLDASQGAKIDIDTGVFFTGCLVIMNLDTDSYMSFESE